MEMKSLLAVDAGDALRPLWVWVAAGFKRADLLHPDPALHVNACQPLQCRVDGTPFETLRSIPDNVRINVAIMLLGFTDASEKEPDVVLAQLPLDAEEGVQRRAAIAWMLCTKEFGIDRLRNRS